MKKVKTIVPIALACTTIIAFFSLGATVSYLTDAEATDNIITIGKVALEVSEEHYEDSKIVAAGGSVAKDPTINNIGSKDEYVFFRVGVPKRNVTLLYEKDTKVGTGEDAPTYKEGTPTVNNRTLDENNNTTEIKTNVDEIYKIIADGVNGTTSTDVSDELGDTAEPKTSPQLDFSYNKGDNTTNSEKEGWIYLKRELNQPTSGTETNKYDYYYFGYNKKLAKEKKTVSLFDRIQLKSFIDEEVNSKDDDKPLNEETQITIDAYGIQADSLGAELNNLTDFVSKEDLQKILNIVNEKQKG